MGDTILAIGIIILWIIVFIGTLVVKHAVFTTYYAEGGCLRELAGAAAISMFLTLFLCWLFVKYTVVCIIAVVLLIAAVIFVVRNQ